MKNEKTFRPDRIFSYFRVEWVPLAFVTLSGLIYNIGLLATPWFEGRLAQCLADILSGDAGHILRKSGKNVVVNIGLALGQPEGDHQQDEHHHNGHRVL